MLAGIRFRQRNRERVSIDRKTAAITSVRAGILNNTSCYYSMKHIQRLNGYCYIFYTNPSLQSIKTGISKSAPYPHLVFHYFPLRFLHVPVRLYNVTLKRCHCWRKVGHAGIRSLGFVFFQSFFPFRGSERSGLQIVKEGNDQIEWQQPSR